MHPYHQSTTLVHQVLSLSLSAALLFFAQAPKQEGEEAEAPLAVFVPVSKKRRLSRSTKLS